MKSGKGLIYLIRNNVNGKGYVGQTIHTVKMRWNQHKNVAKDGGGSLLGKAIRKYGPENFTIREIVTCDELLLNDLETHYIEFFGTFSNTGHGYNRTKGGSYWTPETREKLSSALKGRTQSPEAVSKRKGKNRKYLPCKGCQTPLTATQRCGKCHLCGFNNRPSRAKNGPRKHRINPERRKYLPCAGGCGTLLTYVQRQREKCPTCGAKNRPSRAKPKEEGKPPSDRRKAAHIAHRKVLPCKSGCGTMLTAIQREKGKCPTCGVSNRTSRAGNMKNLSEEKREELRIKDREAGKKYRDKKKAAAQTS